MPLHSPEAVINDLANIKKDVRTIGKGNNCLPDDFAKIHYKGYIATTGRIIADTYTRNDGKPAPKVFTIGHFDEIKCFDLILPQMKQGEAATIRCPSKLVYGSHEKYGQFGSEVIPAYSDIVFTMKVLACKPSAKQGRELTVAPPSVPISEKKQMLQDSKDLAETLKAKILKMTKSLSNSEVMASTETEKDAAEDAQASN